MPDAASAMTTSPSDSSPGRGQSAPLARPGAGEVGRRSTAALWLAGGIAALFFAVNPQVLSDWRVYSFDDGTYSHAYLIPLMSAWVLYTGWQRGAVVLERSLPWMIGLGVVLLAYQWLEFAHQRYPSRVLVPACLALSLMSLLRPNRYVIGAAALFWFVTPVWGPVNEFLQWTSVKAVATIMSYTGIPTYVYAEYVQIPAGTFEIADGCSGLRYVIATLALVTFYGVLYLRSVVAIAGFTLIALLGAMLTNWLRIVALILIGHFTDMESSLIDDHNMFGWFLFFPLMFLIFRLADRLEPRGEMPTGTPTPPTRSLPASAVLPLVALLVLVSGVTVRAAAGQSAYGGPEPVDVDAALPVAMPHSPSPVVYAVTAINAQGIAGRPGSAAYLLSFDGSVDAQRTEFYLNDPVPEGWAKQAFHGGADAVEVIVRSGDRRAVVRYAYGVGSRWTGSKGALRTLRLRAALRLDRSSRLAWVFLPCEAGCSDAERRAGEEALAALVASAAAQ